jgi:hypothetical protein
VKCQGKVPLNNYYTVKKMKEWVLGVDTSGRKEYSQRGWTYFEYVYDNRTVKSVEIVVRRDQRG